MIELLHKVKSELDCLVGPNRELEETDLDTLQYLQAVVKETLRLHPPFPFLLPRKTIQDTNFMSYHIPKNTQVFVNVWTIRRDNECWEDPLSFKPERFLGSNIDYRGQQYELIPFGAGRRQWVGFSLAHRMLNFILGSLLHHFEWELESSKTPETVHMKERLGTTMRKVEPLMAMPRNMRGN